MRICVYCSSSNDVDRVYFEAARRLGSLLAARGDTLIYGGANVGLMGTLARAVSAGGGKVTGVIPEVLRAKRITYEEADRLIVTRTMHDRKATMARYGDAFIALPGGFGTLEELTEILTQRQLQIHDKPLVLLNVREFYKPLIALFEHFYRERFARRWDGLFHVAEDAEGVFEHLDPYRDEPVGSGQEA